MLLKLGEQSILEWVLSRVKSAKMVDRVVLATSTASGDDSLAEIASRMQVHVVRGSESDVLGRFLLAAEMHQAHNVIRVCADNPFIDPEEIDRLILFFEKQHCDYACNHLDFNGSGYADGFGAEIFSTDLLEEIAQLATLDNHREHVSLFILDNPQKYSACGVPAPIELAHPDFRFDVDTEADFLYLQDLVRSGVETNTPAFEIVKNAMALSGSKIS